MGAEQVTDSRGRGHVGRAARSPGQLWQVPVFFVGLLSFAVTFLTAPSRGDPAAGQLQTELTRLRQGVRTGHEEPAILVAQAENLLARLSQFHRQAGEIQFLAGSAYYRQAEQCTPETLAANQKKAIAHLEEALALGVAASDQAALRFRLGWMLYRQGKDQKGAIELLAQSIDKGADDPARGYGMLVEAYLALPKPNLDVALAANQKQLELTDERNSADMAAGRLVRGELLLRKEQRLEALKELDRIGKGAPLAIRLKARLLQARVCADEGFWNRAVPVWKELLNDAAHIDGGKARALYNLGLAYKNSTPPRTDEAIAQWQEGFALGGNDGHAAGFRLGEARLFDGPKTDAAAALAIWTKALANIRTPNDYKIDALKLTRAREILENACAYFLDKHDYERTRQVADLYKRIAPAGMAEERIAQAAEGLARAAKEKAVRLGTAEESDKMQEVRAQFHRAAVAYEEAAAARAEGSPDIYWRSAQCYKAAQDYARAGTVLSKFVTLEKTETRLAEGYLALAEVCVKLGNKDGARQFYYKCIEFPRTPFQAQARYQLALEEMENKNYDKAKDILNDTLVSHGPTQDRLDHEQSIYKMAELHYLMQEYTKAAVYFEQAIEQYPNHKELSEARALFGACYRKLAEGAQRKAHDAKDESTKVHHLNNRHDWLSKAAVVYDALADELEHKARQNALSLKEQELLRDASFTAAEMQFDMNRFPEALRRFVDLQDKYRQKAAGLIACQKIWYCVGLFNEPSESRIAIAAVTAALKKFKADLQTMHEESTEFRGPRVYSKKDWQDWLRQVENALNPTPPPSALRPTPVID